MIEHKYTIQLPNTPTSLTGYRIGDWMDMYGGTIVGSYCRWPFKLG